MNFNTFFGRLGCWLGWSVESKTAESLFECVGDGIVGEIDKPSEMSSSRGSIPLWCEDSVGILEDFGKVGWVVGVVVIVG